MQLAKKLPLVLFLTPSKTDGRIKSQKGAPTICNLTYQEVSQLTYVRTLLPSLGVVIGQNSALTSNQIPSDPMNCLLPRNCFLPRTYYSFQVSQSAKICLKNRYFEKQIHWVPLLDDVWETSAEFIPYWLVIAIVKKCQWAKILPIRAHCSICLEMSWVTGIYEK